MEASKEETCRGVAAVLAAVGAHRMVVGHNRQPGGRPRSRCGGTLHMIDVGLSRCDHRSMCRLLQLHSACRGSLPMKIVGL